MSVPRDIHCTRAVQIRAGRAVRIFGHLAERCGFGCPVPAVSHPQGVIRTRRSPAYFRGKFLAVNESGAPTAKVLK